MKPLRLLPAALALALAACASSPATVDAPAEPADGHDPSSRPMPNVFGADAVPVREAFITEPMPEHEIDSVASWTTPGGDTWLIATGKESHQLVVYDGDTGEFRLAVGGPGEAPGQYTRPNGIAVFGDLVFVVERDSHRVQVQRLPDFAPVAIIGADVLRSPYGLWLHETAPGELEMLVTDSFMADYRTETLPPMAELDQRVRRFRLQLRGEALVAEYTGHFGDTTEEGALRMVESIAGDPAHDRLLIAEEDLRAGTTLRVYDLAGRYQGQNLPRETFKAQAEGVALWACPDGSGYWVTADQGRDRTVFHVFDRRELGYLGSFHGEQTAMTDGIWLDGIGSPRFPYGVLYASHDDAGVAAFDWQDIARSLKIRRSCD